MSIERINDIDNRLSELPKGNLSYKNIKGKRQPYLQWNENGKIRSYYIKVADRERVFLELEERRSLEQEKELLLRYAEEVAQVIRRNAFIKNDISLGYQDYKDFIDQKFMYVDKTYFIEEWLKSKSQVTLITRPRRFGKTLTMSMVEYFFSPLYADDTYLFEKTIISSCSEAMALHGTIPVISLTFGALKVEDSEKLLRGFGSELYFLYDRHSYLLESDNLTEEDKELFSHQLMLYRNGDINAVINGITILSALLFKHYRKKVLLLIDEYDTPMIEAYTKNNWDSVSRTLSEILRSAIKYNRFLDRAILTGITRIAKESLFSDMNNLGVNTLTTGLFSTCFGFTENEVRAILAVRSCDEMDEVKRWYDGYTIAGTRDIYNPWAITCYMREREFKPYWENTGGNGLIHTMLKASSNSLKSDFEQLLNGQSIHKEINEYTTFADLTKDDNNIWSLLLAAGYLRAEDVEAAGENISCKLVITNKDAYVAFHSVIKKWFTPQTSHYNCFINALLNDDIESMNDYLELIFSHMVSYFDVADGPDKNTPERFYHGLVLWLIVELKDEYEITSNRESGFGRYDICLRPKKEGLHGIIIEFKVRNPKREESLELAATKGLKQIDDKKYANGLLAAGVDLENIYKYCIAFDGKEVLVK